jgi:hypothetical protein
MTIAPTLQSGFGGYITGVTEGSPNNETAFVRIPPVYAGGGNPWNLIESKFITTSAYAEESFKTVKDFVNKMDVLINEVELRTPGEITIDLPDIPSFDVTDRPEFGDLDFNANWPKNETHRPDIEAIPELKISVSFSP